MENNDGTKPTDDLVHLELTNKLTHEQLAKFTKTVQDAMQSDMRTSIQEALMGYIGGKGESEPMRALIIGGVFTPMDKQPTQSSSSTIVDTLHDKLRDLYHYKCDSLSSGMLEILKSAATNPDATTPFSVPCSDLIIWMPTIDNDEADVMPKKKQGSTLIVSKVMRGPSTTITGNIATTTPATTTMDAISRIFKFHANAVITIDASVPKQYTFTLIDALGNQWGNATTDLTELTDNIHRFHEWTRKSVRRPTIMANNTRQPEVETLIEVTKQLSQECTKVQGRYFGNCSTRCQSLFPSTRTITTDKTTSTPQPQRAARATTALGVEDVILVSKRNTDKTYLTSDDMVPVMFNTLGNIVCFGNSKPSVDTPVQVRLYEVFPKHNFYIHGHAYIEDAPFTDNYYACGDTREASAIHKIIMTHSQLNTEAGAINLRNHGFFLYADTLANLQMLANSLKFSAKALNEPVYAQMFRELSTAVNNDKDRRKVKADQSGWFNETLAKPYVPFPPPKPKGKT
jgi:ribulose-5-phosphate 4-epimerase/fuculose-1-phosphate aldolase